MVPQKPLKSSGRYKNFVSVIALSTTHEIRPLRYA